MRTLKGFILLGLLVGLPLIQGFPLGRAPQSSVPAWARVSAKRVFLRTLTAGDAGYYVVWNSSGTTDGGSLLAERFAVDDSPRWPAPGLELSKDLVEPGIWDACPDGQSGLIVAVAEENQLRIRLIDAEGGVRWRQMITSSTVDFPVTSVVGVEDGHGGAYFTWAQGPSENSTVWVQHWNAAGAPLWPGPGILAAPSDAHQIQPNIIGDGMGNVLVAWKSYSGDISKVRAQRITPEGQRLWPELGIDVTSPAGDLHQRILMAAPGNGGLVVTWSQGDEGINRLYFQHVGADGTRTWSVAGVTEAGAVIEQWNPVILGNGDDNLWIGWEEVVEGHDPKVMLVRRGPPKGAPWAPGDIRLSPVSGSQGRLALALDGSGGVAAVWVDNRTSTGLYLQEVDGQGGLRYGSGREITITDHHPQLPHLVLAAPGRVAVVWLEEAGDALWDLKHRVVDIRRP